MTDAITHLSSVESRLLQAAGAGIDLAPSAGWLVGLQHDNHHVVTSVLRRNSNMEEKDLQADVCTSLCACARCLMKLNTVCFNRQTVLAACYLLD